MQDELRRSKSYGQRRKIKGEGFYGGDVRGLAKEVEREMIKCPDFDLATLESIPIERFASTPEFQELIFALALGFNDLKTHFWTFDQLMKGKPITKDRSSYNGQWNGMINHIVRMLVLTFAEIVNALKHHRLTVEGAQFRNLVKQLPNSQKKNWLLVEGLSAKNLGENLPTTKAVHDLIQHIRSKAAAHYFIPGVLNDGFKEWRREDLQAAAYFSVGKNMEETRFYFADKIVEMHLRKKGLALGIELDQIYAYLKTANQGVKSLLQVYLRSL